MECCVCLEDKYVFKTPCKHLLCVNCLIKLKKLECPYCRNKLEGLGEEFIKKRTSYHNPVLNFNEEDFPPLG
tara:strand:+ start:276 stop:491 length:216 start_codon:yes stop_codon:yes gene_type:complete